MITETEGIILKQVKTVSGRKMIVLLSKRFGKISAGTSIDEKKKNRSAVSLRPFTYGKYEVHRTGENYHLNAGETIASHYGLGEDIEKYMAASYVMELTDKLIPEDQPCPDVFQLLNNFLDAIERRGKKYETLVLAFLMKALTLSGNAPKLDACVSCGSRDGLGSVHIGEGGVLCSQCRKSFEANERLIYDVEFGIVNALRYLAENPLNRLEKLALDENTLRILWKLMKSYLAYHLDITDLKSEELMADHGLKS